MVRVTYYGNATFAISAGKTTVLVDPYLTDNDECPWDATEVYDRETPDALCVTHVAFDHVGDTAQLATEYTLPVLTEPATVQYLRHEGVTASQLTSVVWGMAATIGDLDIRILETRHASIREVDGTFLSGTPLSFLFVHGDVGVYHLGDTAIFQTLQTFGELYEPNAILLGVGQAYDAPSEDPGPITRRIHELTIEEAVLVTEWLDPEYVIPMHYVQNERAQFLDALETADSAVTPVPLDPGETIHIE